MNNMNSDTGTCLLQIPDMEQLEDHVRCRLSGMLRDFQVSRLDDGLVLRGHCRTYYAKQLAQHAVMEATDLPIVANEIEVC